MFIEIIAKNGRKLPKTGRKLPKMSVFCGKNVPLVLLFVAGMGEKMYLCRFDSFGRREDEKWIHEDGAAR